ncbi:unnamed protein product [Urochloa humidicola]
MQQSKRHHCFVLIRSCLILPYPFVTAAHNSSKPPTRDAACSVARRVPCPHTASLLSSSAMRAAAVLPGRQCCCFVTAAP